MSDLRGKRCRKPRAFSAELQVRDSVFCWWHRAYAPVPLFMTEALSVCIYAALHVLAAWWNQLIAEVYWAVEGLKGSFLATIWAVSSWKNSAQSCLVEMVHVFQFSSYCTRQFFSFPHTAATKGLIYHVAKTFKQNSALHWNHLGLCERKQIFSPPCFIWVSPGGEQHCNETQTGRWNFSVMAKCWCVKTVWKLQTGPPQRGSEEYQVCTASDNWSTACWEMTQLFRGECECVALVTVFGVFSLYSRRTTWVRNVLDTYWLNIDCNAFITSPISCCFMA